ncbi:MAG: disulfide bond formation protein B [Gemmataceae bacterium]
MASSVPPSAGYPPHVSAASPISWLTWLVAVIALAASLGLTLSLQLRACPLCLYERLFVMGVVAVYTVGLLLHQRPGERLGFLALPMAAGALTTIGFHEYLEFNHKLECPPGYLGLGTAPQQALVILVVLTVLVIADAFRGMRSLAPFSRLVLILGAAGLGVLLSYAAINTSPKIPADYSKPLDMCRPPKPAD